MLVFASFSIVLLSSSNSTPINCLGNSSKLPLVECEAWTDFFDATHGEQWKFCSANRLDPCSCNTEYAKVTCKQEREITHISLIHAPYSSRGGTLPSTLGNLKQLQYFEADCMGLNGTLPAVHLFVKGDCVLNDPLRQSDCEQFGGRPNSFSCPLPPGASEHCYATCQ